LTEHHAMKAYWGWRYNYTHSLTSALDGGEWSASRSGRLTPRERAPGTHWIGSWVGPRAVLDAAVKRKIPSPLQESNPRTPIAGIHILVNITLCICILTTSRMWTHYPKVQVVRYHTRLWPRGHWDWKRNYITEETCNSGNSASQTAICRTKDVASVHCHFCFNEWAWVAQSV
jgi:hypothetical protein